MKNENYEFPRVVPVPVKNICTCNLLYKIVRSDVVNLRMERVYIQTYVNIFVNRDTRSYYQIEVYLALVCIQVGPF